jgi:hypothetical protein
VTYWQSRGKEIIVIGTRRTTDREGNECIVPVIPRFKANFIPCVPHYTVPRPCVNEDGSLKRPRLVVKEDV